MHHLVVWWPNVVGIRRVGRSRCTLGASTVSSERPRWEERSDARDPPERPHHPGGPCRDRPLERALWCPGRALRRQHRDHSQVAQTRAGRVPGPLQSPAQAALEGERGGAHRGLRAASRHRLPARRPHLRGRPLPAELEPGCGLPHPQGRRPESPAAGEPPAPAGRDLQGLRARLRASGREKHLPKLRTADGELRKRYLFVAIDRRSRFVHLAVKDDETEASARTFLEAALTAFPFQVTHVLTDRGSCFTAEGFEKLCRARGIEHRKTRPYTPRTNGMVERFNGRIQREVLGLTVASHRDLERLLKGFNAAYNARRQRVLGGRSPEQVVRERLRDNESLANPGYRPPPDPCLLPKALLVVERAKDVSQPDSSARPWRYWPHASWNHQHARP